MSRFDYVKYDDVAQAKQAKLKAAAQRVEQAILNLEDARDAMDDVITAEIGEGEHGMRAIEQLNDATGPDVDDAMVSLEQAYMWCGKALRDEQIERNGSAELLEERKDG